MNRIRNLLSMLAHINENPKAIQFRNKLSAPLVNFLLIIGLRPTPLNFIGLFAGLLAAFIVATGNFPLAAIVLLVSGLADALDGAVARALKVESDFGIFFDSVCDRYIDTAFLLGLSWYFMNQSASLYVFLTFVIVIGTVVTSYSRARAESLSLSSRYIGFMNRPERVILLLIGVIFPQTLLAICWILAILTNITAIHRIIFYSAEARQRAQNIQHSVNIDEKAK